MKFYVATPRAGLISALGMAPIVRVKLPHESCVRIPVWDSLKYIILRGLAACNWYYVHHRGSE